MDVRRGFQIEDPLVFVPWRIATPDLRRLLPKTTEVTSGYFVTECVSLGGLRHMLGFHFEPRDGGELVELEFFRRSYPDLRASFDEFQRHLEATFGRPTRTATGDEGLPALTWFGGGATIRHFVLDRFGPEEHVRIRVGRAAR
jgi:hypothetical protein